MLGVVVADVDVDVVVDVVVGDGPHDSLEGGSHSWATDYVCATDSKKCERKVFLNFY